MARYSKDKQGIAFLLLSMGGFLCASVSFLLIPIEKLTVNLPALFFYGGLIVGIAFQIVLEIRRRAFFKKYKVKQSKFQKPRNGLLSFGSNKIALVVDSVCIASVILTVCAFAFMQDFDYLCCGSITVLLMSFCLHCILNGRNYFHLKNFEKIRLTLENKKESNSRKGEGENEKK